MNLSSYVVCSSSGIIIHHRFKPERKNESGCLGCLNLSSRYNRADSSKSKLYMALTAAVASICTPVSSRSSFVESVRLIEKVTVEVKKNRTATAYRINQKYSIITYIWQKSCLLIFTFNYQFFANLAICKIALKVYLKT